MSFLAHWAWCTHCRVPARFSDSAPASEVLLWSTEPPPPGLFLSLTGVFEFDGYHCSDVALLSAFCQVSAHWPTAWTPAPAPPAWLLFLGSRQPQPPPWDWSTPWIVFAAFTAAASAAELFDCDTLPSLPGLSMRTRVLLLLAPFCFDVAL